LDYPRLLLSLNAASPLIVCARNLYCAALRQFCALAFLLRKMSHGDEAARLEAHAAEILSRLMLA
jgi:hypothetical protein